MNKQKISIKYLLLFIVIAAFILFSGGSKAEAAYSSVCSTVTCPCGVEAGVVCSSYSPSVTSESQVCGDINKECFDPDCNLFCGGSNPGSCNTDADCPTTPNCPGIPGNCGIVRCNSSHWCYSECSASYCSDPGPTPTPTPTPVNNLPVGWHDLNDNLTCTAYGWAYDVDAGNNPIAVHVYKDSPSSGNFVGGYVANAYRSDINNLFGSNHAFSITFPNSGASASLYDGSRHWLYIYAINYPANGSNPLLGGSPKPIQCCPAPVNPTGLTATCNAAGNQVTLSWNNVSGSSPYYFRLNDLTNGWDDDCSPLFPGDICDTYPMSPSPTTTRTISVVPGRNYDWWIHSSNACGRASSGVTGNFRCDAPANPIPTLTFYANPTEVNRGLSTTLFWSVTNANWCWASGDWSGFKSIVAGTNIERIIQLQTDKNFYLNCGNSFGETGPILAHVTVNVPSYSCAGNAAQNSHPCSGDESDVPIANLPRMLVGDSESDCTSRKCEYICNDGTIFRNGACLVSEDGSCGSAQNSTHCQKPSGNDLCVRGNASDPVPSSDGTKWEWICKGDNGGTDSEPCKSGRSCAYKEVVPN